MGAHLIPCWAKNHFPALVMGMETIIEGKTASLRGLRHISTVSVMRISLCGCVWVLRALIFSEDGWLWLVMPWNEGKKKADDNDEGKNLEDWGNRQEKDEEHGSG